jgi:hypothetical protein
MEEEEDSTGEVVGPRGGASGVLGALAWRLGPGVASGLVAAGDAALENYFSAPLLRFTRP